MGLQEPAILRALPGIVVLTDQNCYAAVAANEDQQHRLQRWQLWPLLLGLLHHSPECGQAAYDPNQEAMTDTMSCLTICAEALAAAAPWQAETQARNDCCCTFPMHVSCDAHLFKTADRKDQLAQVCQSFWRA